MGTIMNVRHFALCWALSRPWLPENNHVRCSDSKSKVKLLSKQFYPVSLPVSLHRGRHPCSAWPLAEGLVLTHQGNVITKIVKKPPSPIQLKKLYKPLAPDGILNWILKETVTTLCSTVSGNHLQPCSHSPLPGCPRTDWMQIFPQFLRTETAVRQPIIDLYPPHVSGLKPWSTLSAITSAVIWAATVCCALSNVYFGSNTHANRSC